MSSPPMLDKRASGFLQLVDELNSRKYSHRVIHNELNEKVNIFYLPDDHYYLKRFGGSFVSFLGKGDVPSGFILLRASQYKKDSISDSAEFTFYHEMGHSLLHLENIANSPNPKSFSEKLTKEIEANIYASVIVGKAKALIALKNRMDRSKRVFVKLHNDPIKNKNKISHMKTHWLYYFSYLTSYYYVKYRM